MLKGLGNRKMTNLYIDLLKKVLTNTLFEAEPDIDEAVHRFVPQFTKHYIQGQAITMQPMVRLDNLQFCVESVIKDKVPGDVIETGVWRGGACILMRAILKQNNVTDRTVWVADSFEGLPEPDAEKFPTEAKAFHGPVITKAYDRFAAGLELVQANFKAFGLLDEQVKFLKGWFKDTLPGAPIERLAIIRLDGDYYESTMDPLNALYDKLSVGGYVIVDDYGEDLWTNCRQAIEDFRKARGITDEMIRVDSKCSYWRRSR
jgi:hypothetical protein